MKKKQRRRTILETIAIPDRGSPIISYRISLEDRIALQRRYWDTREPNADFLREILHKALREEGRLEVGIVPRRRKAS